MIQTLNSHYLEVILSLSFASPMESYKDSLIFLNLSLPKLELLVTQSKLENHWWFFKLDSEPGQRFEGSLLNNWQISDFATGSVKSFGNFGSKFNVIYL